MAGLLVTGDRFERVIVRARRGRGFSLALTEAMSGHVALHHERALNYMQRRDLGLCGRT